MKKFYTVLTIALLAISASAQLTVTVDNVIEDPCEGGNKGAIEITVTGGTPGYQFNWEGPFGIIRHEEDIYNLSGGNWNLTVYDTLGASYELSVFVPIASGMLVNFNLSIYGELNMPYNISEFGKSDGWIWVEYVLDGNGNPNSYQFSWEHNGWWKSTGYRDTLTNLGPGKYTLVITDSVGCTDTTGISLTQPDPETVIDTVEVIKFTEVAEEATLINPVTQAAIWVKNFGEYIRTSETFDLCKVYNIAGSVVRQLNNETDIPVSDLETGIYIFYLEFGTVEMVQRFYIK